MGGRERPRIEPRRRGCPLGKGCQVQNANEKKAAMVARKIRIPMVSDKTTAELYGYVVMVLDEKAARKILAAYWATAFGVHTLTDDLMDLMVSDVRCRADVRAA